jgi:hypothetical protein
VKKATSNNSPKAMSLKLVNESGWGLVGGGGAFERLPCACRSIASSCELPGATFGKPLPRGLLLYVNGRAKTTERHESPIKEVAEIIEECIMDYLIGVRVDIGGMQKMKTLI